MKNINNIMWGFVLLIVGIIFGLNALEITNINIFFKGWWALLIIILCVVDLFNNENKNGDIIGIIIGVILLLLSLDIISLEQLPKLLITIGLVLGGLGLIFNNSLNKKGNKELKNKNNIEEYAATFGEQQLEFNNQKFNGCNLNAIFGSVNCDISKSKINEDCIINTTSIFGGITIITSDKVNVKIKQTPIFGAVSNKRQTKIFDEYKKTIYINAVCLFGGVDIK